MYFMKHFLYIILLFAVISCSEDSNPSSPVANTFVQPKTGSTFTLEEADIDTVTGAKISVGMDTSVHTIAQTAMKYMGKENVSLITSSEDPFELRYINYEADSNISMYSIYGFRGKWIEFPVKSKNTIITRSDTSNIKSGAGTIDSNSATVSFQGEEKINVKGKEIKVNKLRVDITKLSKVITSMDTSSFTSSSVFYLYYAPSLGFIVKEERTNYPTLKIRAVTSLLDYQLK